MKNIITGTLFTFLVVTGFCQSPNFFKYQAILRDKSGILISEKSVAMRISILKGTAEGSVLYSETHTLKTNSLGTINLEIGNGVVKSGTFVAIEWGSSIHFVKIEMDPLGGSAFEVVGVSQLLSVPYSLYAQKSGDEKWDNATGGINYAKGNVGIGTSTPTAKLDIQGLNSNLGIYKTKFTATESVGKGRFELKNDPSDQGIVYSTSLDRVGDTSEDLLFGFQHPIGNTTSWGVLESWHGAGLMVSSSGDELNPLILGINRIEKARLAGNGNFGIGTSNPKSKLQVESGDIYISDLTKGVIMKSPNGTCWRMTVNDSGIPVFSSITCP